MADLAAGADVGELVLDALDPQHSPAPVEQVGVPLVTTHEGDMDRRAALLSPPEHGSAVRGQRLQALDP